MKYIAQKGCYAVPFGINISVTEKCPLKCPMCFQPFGRYSELNMKTICNYLDEMSMLGIKLVQFSGGEPLSYPYLTQILKHAHENGLLTRISTSGVGLTEAMAKQFREAGLGCCHVSLNGSTESVHRLTREGFYETQKALGILSDTSLPISINWVANQANIHDLPNLIKLAKSYNVRYVCVLSNKNSNSHQVLYQLTYNDLCTLGKYCQEYPNYLDVERCFYQLVHLINNRKSKFTGCRAGRFYMAISAKNEFLPCPHLDNAKKHHTSIIDYWNNNIELAAIRDVLKTNQHKNCAGCINQANCTPCFSEMYSTSYDCLLHKEENGGRKIVC